MKYVAIPFLLTLLSTGVDAASFEVKGLRNRQGQVICTLYLNAAGFPAEPEKAAGQKIVPISDDNRATCDFDVAAGTVIAVAVLHDEDRNGQMKTNFIGIPPEGWAASNNAEAQTFGPPRFDDAKLSATDDLRQVLSVNY